jgi:hypothetical protein
MYVYVYVCMCVCMYVCMYVCVCVCVCVMYMWMCVCTFLCNVCMCVCMFVCIVFMYVCIFPVTSYRVQGQCDGFVISLHRTAELLGHMIVPLQGLYLYWTTRQRESKDKRPCPKRESNRRSSVQALKARVYKSMIFVMLCIRVDADCSQSHYVCDVTLQQ